MIADSLPNLGLAAPMPNLANQIADDFFRSGYPPLRFVTVVANGGVVTLRGRVPSFYLKQLAQHRAVRVPGALIVENRLVVD